MKKKVGIAVVIILIAAAGTTVALGLWHHEPDDRIFISGNIEMTQVDVAFKTAGKLVELNFAEGTQVEKGQVLARIDQEQLRRQRGRDQAGLVSAKTQLTQSRTAIDFQKASLAGDLELKNAELRQAQAKLDELLAGSRPQEIQQARSAVAEAQTQRDQAAADWQRAQTLYKNEDISTSQRDQYKARFDATGAVLEQAQERFGLVKEGPRKEDIASARAQVARARAAIKLSEATRIDIQRKEQELATRRAEIERARSQVGITESQLDDTVAAAPVSGVVLVKPVESGEVVAAGTTIATIADLDRPWLRGYLSEQNYGRVQLGAKAKVTTDSFPGKIYWGRVSFIASEAEFTPKQIQTKEERVKLVYRIKIDLDNSRHELKSNMPVDAEILLKESER